MNVLDAIGNTPLLDLSFLLHRQIKEKSIKVYAKAEYLNPSGSVKDRAAKAIFIECLLSGQLTKQKSLLDATSGNTGISYAMIGAALGYKVTLCLPKNASDGRKQVLRAYDAHIIETDPLLSSDGAQLEAKKLSELHPDLYFYSDQYNNEANWKAHYETTALEIWAQTNQKITHFVAGMGTSGTFMGTSRRLKELNPSLKAVAVQPDSPFHGLEGMKHMSSTILPGIYDATLINETIEVETEEAMKMTLRLAREMGIFVGISSGANVLATLELAKRLPDNSVVVTILCDSGFRYLSESLWRESL